MCEHTDPAVEALDERLHRTRGAGVDLVFRVRGTGPAVVFLHGTSANHAVWDTVGDLLCESATVIALDQRGHGRSDKPEHGYTGPDFAADVITVLDALGIEQAVVVGHSLGGRNAWLAASLASSRIRGAVIIDYTPYVEASVLDALDERVAAGFREFADLAEVKQYLRDRYTRILPDAVDRRAEWGYRETANGTLAPLADPLAMKQLIAGFRTPWDAEFRAVATPMVHLRGADSTIVSPESWARAQADRPNDRWIEISAVDHYVPEEVPELVADEIRALLAQPQGVTDAPVH